VEGFETIVAIKRILPSAAEDEEFIRMFVDEAMITSQFSHANLAQTFDLGKVDDTSYIAMEYVAGKDLRAMFERLKRRGDRMPLTLAAWTVGRACEGLDYAHRRRDTSGRDLQVVIPSCWVLPAPLGQLRSRRPQVRLLYRAPSSRPGSTRFASRDPGLLPWWLGRPAATGR